MMKQGKILPVIVLIAAVSSVDIVAANRQEDCEELGRMKCHCGSTNIAEEYFVRMCWDVLKDPPECVPCNPSIDVHEICVKVQYCALCDDIVPKCLRCPEGRTGVNCEYEFPSLEGSTNDREIPPRRRPHLPPWVPQRNFTWPTFANDSAEVPITQRPEKELDWKFTLSSEHGNKTTAASKKETETTKEQSASTTGSSTDTSTGDSTTALVSAAYGGTIQGSSSAPHEAWTDHDNGTYPETEEYATTPGGSEPTVKKVLSPSGSSYRLCSVCGRTSTYFAFLFLCFCSRRWFS